MRITIAGGTGLIGQALIDAFKEKHDITVITRNVDKAKKKLHDIECTSWDSCLLEKAFQRSQLVINLVGENISSGRWSKGVKDKIINSRVNTTQKICDACLALPPEQRPRLMNASAIGIYGIQPTLTQQQQVTYTEESPIPDPATDFLSYVGRQWEESLDKAKELSIIKLRFGVVLSPKGGMLARLITPFKLGLGGPIGSGAQPISWIAIDDVIAIIEHLMAREELSGAFNLVAPQILSQKEFAITLAKALNRPCVLPMPALAVKLLFGQMGEELLLNGQSVVSRRLADFKFTYPSFEDALAAWDI